MRRGTDTNSKFGFERPPFPAIFCGGRPCELRRDHHHNRILRTLQTYNIIDCSHFHLHRTVIRYGWTLSYELGMHYGCKAILARSLMVCTAAATVLFP